VPPFEPPESWRGSSADSFGTDQPAAPENSHTRPTPGQNNPHWVHRPSLSLHETNLSANIFTNVNALLGFLPPSCEWETYCGTSTCAPTCASSIYGITSIPTFDGATSNKPFIVRSLRSCTSSRHAVPIFLAFPFWSMPAPPPSSTMSLKRAELLRGGEKNIPGITRGISALLSVLEFGAGWMLWDESHMVRGKEERDAWEAIQKRVEVGRLSRER